MPDHPPDATPAARPDAVFHVWELPRSKATPAFYIESTATTNVEAVYDLPARHAANLQAFGSGTKLLPDDTAISYVADVLSAHPETAELVLLIHGFNTPALSARALMQRARATVNADDAISRREGTVLVGYDWPSEHVGAPWSSVLSAAPGAIWTLLVVSMVQLLFGLGSFVVLGSSPASTGLALLEYVGIVMAAALLWRTNPRGKVGGAILLAVLLLGAVLGGLSAVLGQARVFYGALYVVWWTLFLVIFPIAFGVVALRVFVYFRDIYRATNYGVLDLVEVIRHLDNELHTRLAPGARVGLSFVGHSMGAFVVTNIVRILSDVFHTSPSPAARVPVEADSATGTPVYPRAQAAPCRPVPPPFAPAGVFNSVDRGNSITWVGAEVGDAFGFQRLVLVSPDIPAEALMLGRNNFLKSSLRRFPEAYLFSNEGDEVLHLLSRLANYFSFPTGSGQHNFRLGNVQLGPPARPDRLARLAARLLGFLQRRRPAPPSYSPWPDVRAWTTPQYGVINLPALEAIAPAEILPTPAVIGTFVPYITLGTNTGLWEYLDQPVERGQDWPFPLKISYFDCTDYRDHKLPDSGPVAPYHYHPPDQDDVGLLTLARCKLALGLADHYALLLQYFFKPAASHVDVHAGYFSGPFCSMLIYRLACLGFAGTLDALPQDTGAPAATPDQRYRALHEQLAAWCAEKQIKVLLSPARYREIVPPDRAARPTV